MTHTTAVLTCTSAPMPGAVPLLFTPDKLSMDRSASYRSHGSSSPNGGNKGSKRVFERAEPLLIKLNDVTFTGGETKALCDQLLNWLSPGSGAAGQAVAGVLAKKGFSEGMVNRQPVLSFVYGGPPALGFFYQVVLTHVHISYTRFTAAGAPVRAKVSIDMKEQPSLLGTLPTNPTSGGLPGRRSYTVTEGEDLVNLARTQYGSTSHWRRLADANAIDDPLRMRPGTTVYLPNPHEFD
ncbi:LysM peptidoglycan-binding domain-containing protein [Streptomyces sp. IBSNAI002]|uniref:LysM peptidoglycan-binding domain-containing protein n=1 Tax=Streptomyces sp. IBSNAI002 TaxID=3457500 RepID=UPI003FD3E77F